MEAGCVAVENDIASLLLLGSYVTSCELPLARGEPSPANSLTAEETAALWRGIRETLQGAVDLGGTHWEQNLYGQGGSFDMDCLLVGYR